MLASITPLGERGRNNRWWRTAAALAAGCVAGGWALGAAAGLLGRGVASLVASGDTLAAAPGAVGAAVVLLGAGGAELAGWRPPTVHRQVDEDWLPRYRGWIYGGGYGVQLGVGLATTVTTAAVYAAVAVLALVGATGDLRTAQVAGGAFGLARALPVLAGARLSDPERLRRRIRRVAAASTASRLAAGASLCVLAAVAAS